MGGGEHTYTNTKSVVSIFEEIVASDLKRLRELKYDGLAKTLYYWSCFYKIFRTYISWSGFLKLCDQFNNNGAVISSRFSVFDQNNAVHKILSHYISRKEFINPRLKQADIFLFNHDLLANDGISKVVFKDWHPFDMSIITEVINLLTHEREWNTIIDMIGKIFQSGKLGDHPRIDLPFSKADFPGFCHLIELDHYLESCLENSKTNNDEEYWLYNLNYFIYVFRFNDEDLIALLKKVMDKGCNSKYISIAYSYLLNYKRDELEKLLESVESPDSRWRMGRIINFLDKELKSQGIGEVTTILHAYKPPIKT